MNKDQIEKYEQFAKEKLGFEFNDLNLLITALTHRSYINEHKKANQEHNERLEFLGDAVLEMVTSDYLYRKFDVKGCSINLDFFVSDEQENYKRYSDYILVSPLLRVKSVFAYFINSVRLKSRRLSPAITSISSSMERDSIAN